MAQVDIYIHNIAHEDLRIEVVPLSISDLHEAELDMNQIYAGNYASTLKFLLVFPTKCFST